MNSNLDFMEYKLDSTLCSSLLKVLFPCGEGYVPQWLRLGRRRQQMTHSELQFSTTTN